jgi:hypothetical protein
VVERDLPKVDVEGSTPFTRSEKHVVVAEAPSVPAHHAIKIWLMQARRDIRASR